MTMTIVSVIDNVNDTGDKLFTVVNDTSNHSLPVSMMKSSQQNQLASTSK
jgi:hypothetical protein